MVDLDVPKCPTCGVGTLSRSELGEPDEFTCGHQSMMSQLRVQRSPLGTAPLPLDEALEAKEKILQKYPGLFAHPVTPDEAKAILRKKLSDPQRIISIGEPSVNIEMKPDALTDMMMRQLQLQVKINPEFEHMTNERMMDFIRTTMLSLVSELCEMLSETNWKPWAAVEPGIKSKQRYLKEIIDAQHFLFNLALVAGVKPHDYYLAFIEKNEVNFKRQEHEYDGNNPRCVQCGNEVETYKDTTIMDGETPLSLSAKWWCDDDCYNRWQSAREARHHNEGRI